MQDKLLSTEKKSDGFGFFAVLLLVLVVIFHVLNNFIMIVRVDGGSMNNTLLDEDVLIVTKNSEIERGDVVVFDMTYSKLIKRVIALEGDEIYAENGTVYLKKSGETEFAPLVEDYIIGENENFSLVKVGNDKIFVMGDNREHSHDGRDFGTIPLDKVDGVVEKWSIDGKETLNFLLGWAFEINEFLGRIL